MQPKSRFGRGLLLALVAVAGGCQEGTSSIDRGNATLRSLFPEQAAHVLAGAGKFEWTADGFARSAPPGESLEVVLPRHGDGAARFKTAAGFEARVREIGAEGRGVLGERGLSYRRAGGTSYWTVTEGGAEEWLLIDAPAVKRGQALAAWEVSGGRVRGVAGVVEIADDDGVPRVRVTAPLAYAAGGREIAAHLEVRDSRIEISVDAEGETVLVDPSWTPTGVMINGRIRFAAVLLGDGSVLAAGGRSTGNTFPVGAERYDPLTNTWSAAGNISVGREYTKATWLPSIGKALLTGGQNAAVSFANADLYDPVSNTWTPTADMPAVRSTHTQTTLSDGRALVASGNTNTALVYEPLTAGWTPTGTMVASRSWSSAALLQNGKVLVAGGQNLASAELYDPATNTWTDAGAMSITRVFHGLTTLPDGRVLATGGALTFGGALQTSVDIYDPVGNGFTPVMPMGTARQQHTATLLDSGLVLVTGGQSATTELYDPAANSWTPSVSMSIARTGHTATLLTDGRVLAATGGINLKTAEFYSQGLGAPCVTGVQCPGGFCADGVCCNTACNSPCDVCSIAAGAQVDGTCVPAPASVVCRPVADVCDVKESCDGVNPTCPADMFLTNSTTCRFAVDTCDAAENCTGASAACPPDGVKPAGSPCDDGDACTATDTCQGGTCVGSGAPNCGNYICSGAGCLSSCSSNSDCVGGTVCIGSQCVSLLPDGNACTLGSQCVSGFCADGVCCNLGCGGLCQACTAAKKGSGADGVCGAVANGSDPDNECAAQAASTCGTTGTCDGAGACKKHAAGTVCAASSCNGSVLTNASTCDGSGSCMGNGTTNCSPFLCVGGACTSTLPNGAACSLDNQCASGFCADSVCCDLACGGLCQACTAAKKGSGADGVCGAVATGSDPDNECATQATSTCGTNGSCDGAGACKKYAAGTVCVPSSCNGSVQTNASTCDGNGSCLGNGTTNCSPFLCVGGVCASTLPDGSACVQGTQCASGFCADGVCCDVACGGLCQACTAVKKGSGADGACGAVATGSDPDNECATQATSTCGTNGSCDGAGACKKYAAGTVCVPSSCNGSVQTNASTCDGNGSCLGNGTTNCSPFMCVGGVCASTFPNGSACAQGTQCASGVCADGVCCDLACGGLCQACTVAKKGSGADGACGPVAVGSDPDGECAVQPVSGCGTNGSCDGAGACQKYAAGTICVPASCNGSTQINASTCDGNGTCAGNGNTDCGQFACAGGVCLSTCVVDFPDCGVSGFCDSGICAGKLPNGAACGGQNECQSAFCVDGVCCDGPCGAGVCDACSVAAGAPVDGVCAPLDGAACDDGTGCTQTDACSNGVCIGSNEVTCTPTECEVASACNPALGVCAAISKLDGTPCTGGVCIAGLCVDDVAAGPSGASNGSGGSGVGGGGASSGGGGEASNGATSGAGGAGGAGGSSAKKDDGELRVVGGCGACTTGRSSGGEAPWIALAALALAVARRRNSRENGCG